jgi:hypothetical protein
MVKQPRHQSVVSRQSDAGYSDDHWLREFESKLQKTSVQPRGESIYDQINSIMNTKSKYPSVQAAVDDMMQRSGLNSYLDNVKESQEQISSETSTKTANSLKNEIDQLKDLAKIGDWFAFGKLMAKIDMAEGQPRINGAESIRLIKYFKDPELSSVKVPLEKWELYTRGYGEEQHLSPEEQEKDIRFTRQILDNILNRSKTAQTVEPKKSEDPSANKTPQVIQDKPSILRTLENIIKETRGNMPIPAIIARLQSLHARDISSEAVWDDERLLRLISQMNLQAKKDNPSSFENFDHLGQSDHATSGDDIDASNTDAFNALMPARI